MRIGIATFVGCALLAVSLVSGCRKADQKATEESQIQYGTPIMPERLADADPATPATTFDIDEKTGRSKALLVLRLDYFPAPKPGVTNLPVCYKPFAETFDVGVATCEGNAEIQVPVQAKNLDQDCYTDPTVERITALQPLVIPGCAKGRVVVHGYEPKLRVDVEIRDLK